MAIIKRGILGGFSGKVAGVVGSSWKGKAVMKSLPLSVANPRTAKQTAQRSKFKAVGQFGSDILVSCIKPLRDRFAQQQSGFNTFVSKNIDKFAGDTLIQPLFLSISEGNLEPVENLAGTGNIGAQTINISWDNNSTVGNADPTDEFFVAIHNEATKTQEGFNTGATRSTPGTTVTMTNEFDTGEKLYFYGSFRRADGTIVSNSVAIVETMP